MSVLVVFSVDVEEEGLFSGRYAASGSGVTNVAQLSRLEFLTREFALPLTLLCTHPVLADSGCAALLRRMQDGLGAELGCHLHPWNTPPFHGPADESSLSWSPSQDMSAEALDAKLATLVCACRAVSGRTPISFRMGRFDLGPRVRGLLAGHGLRVDSSLVPLSFNPALPETFLAPTDPHPLCPGVLEAPLTMAALSPRLRNAAWAVAQRLPARPREALLRGFQSVAAAGTQPVWYPLASMKLGAKLHLKRGGRVVHIFLHSSELAPGACPHLPDEAGVARLITRIRDFLRWLEAFADPLGGLRSCTMGQLPQALGLDGGCGT